MDCFLSPLLICENSCFVIMFMEPVVPFRSIIVVGYVKKYRALLCKELSVSFCSYVTLKLGIFAFFL